MSPQTLRLAVMLTALAGLAFLSFPPCSLSQEDTAHLVLKKKAVAAENPSIYIVQKGDNLSTIIRRKLGRPAEFKSVYRLVKKLNPHIRDVNRIYPGQKIVLPLAAGETTGKAQYSVGKGDTLSSILHEQLGIARGEMAKWIEIVKRLNPGLGDPDRIYPGQILILPERGSTESPPAEQAPAPLQVPAEKTEKKPYRPTEQDFSIIATVVKQAGGTLIRRGKYFIPLTEQEHLAVDCSDIPIVDLYDGSRIFLDYALRVPDETAALMRSRWKNVTVITGGWEEGIFPLLSAIFNASRDFTFRLYDGYLDMGSTPALKLRVDWILARKGAEGQERFLFGICRTDSPSQPIPEPVVRFAEKRGYPVVEVDKTSGAVRERPVSYSASDVPSVAEGGNRAFVGSLLDMLGYVYTTDRRLPVTDPAGKEPPLTMRTDFAVKIGARTVLIHFGDLPAPLQESVKEQGMGLVQIAVDDERKLVLEKVLSGLDIPMTIDHAEFRPPEDGGPARWIVTLGTIHLTSDRGAFYLVPSDADRDLCAFIRERWGRPIIRY